MQVFNLLVIVAGLTGIGISVLALAMREQVFTILTNMTIAVASFLLLIIAGKTKRYQLCGRLLVIVLFFILFPAVYLLGGGYNSGLQYIFLLAFTFTLFLLDRYERVVVLILETVIYAFCFTAYYFNPEVSLVQNTEQNNFLFSTLNFVIVSVVLLIILLIRNRLVNNKQKEILELGLELSSRNDELAQYDNMKSDFLATVAHEINTPLAIIAASSSDTLDLLDEESINTEDIIENQKIIQQRVKLIDNIIEDLMDTVAIEKGRLKLNLEPADMASLIKNVCGVQHKKLDINNNNVVFELPPGLKPILIDKQRIEQVLINLLSNAFNHTKNGTITIKLVHRNGKQTVSIIDNGAGMDKEMARIVLKQYVSTKADYWKHGIGLYICRQIISAHKGEIWIDSEKGYGTNISFTLMEEPGNE